MAARCTRAGLATVDWSDIPLAMEDIERIEVFRGPNTVSYGANALMAVVNILTRNPADSHGTRLKVTRGEDGINDFYASHGFGWDGGGMRLSLSGQQDDGFDHDQFGQDYRDSRRLTRFNLDASHNLAGRPDPGHGNWRPRKAATSGPIPTSRYSPDVTRCAATMPTSMPRTTQGRSRWNIDFNSDHSLYVQWFGTAFRPPTGLAGL